MDKSQKVVIIGLDGLNPDLVYQRKDKLPTLKKIMEQGMYGKIKSTIPPLTAPSWSCVLSGKNLGHFGFWDSTYRKDYSYKQLEIVNSVVRDERVDALYKILSKYNKKVAIINVPFTYPPPKIPNGYSISSFMTFSPDEKFTHPASLKSEIERMTGEYIIDVFTSNLNLEQINKEKVLKKIRDMDQQRFNLTKYFIKDKKCDFIFTVVAGTDRVSHLFYRYFDENHPRYTPDAKYKDIVKNHYKLCDDRIGEIVSLVGEDTVIIVLSSYAAQRLDGRINLNEWLIKEGYMKLNTRRESPTPLMQADIDWSKTKAWVTGYSGGLYLNVKGREPEGTVEPKDYDKALDELTEKLKGIKDDKGRILDAKVYKRKDIHSGEYARFGPDLFVSFNNYHWGTSELIGYNSLHSYYTPKGPDDGAHGSYGFFALVGLGIPQKGKISKADLLDIAPTVLDLFGIPIPQDMEGKVLTEKEKVTSKEEEEIKERLSRLGYLG